MDRPLKYDPSAAVKLLPIGCLEALKPKILLARDEVNSDVELFYSGRTIPTSKQPLDAGFIDLPARLLSEASQEGSLLQRIKACANRLRKDIDRLVLLGIGGSYMGARALFEALCLPYHNELARYERNETPRLYYEGENIDNDWVDGLLYLLKTRSRDPRDINQRWGTIVISKSGGTLETAVAFRLIRKAMEEYYGTTSDYLRKFIVPVTGLDKSNLKKIADHLKVDDLFPIPEGVGGRFSIFTAVGLLPAAVMGIDIDELLRGAADITARFRSAPYGDNPILDYVAVCHAFESAKPNPRTIRILSTWGKRLEAVGLWYDQLLSESLGKHERGATPITIVNTRDLHSRGQQHQEGALDKLITNVIVESSATNSISVPPFEDNLDNLNSLCDKNLPDILGAAIQGTNQAYQEVARPTADIKLPRLDAYSLGQFFQMMMLSTVVEGRLLCINPFGQPGVEAYKNNMLRLLGLHRR